MHEVGLMQEVLTLAEAAARGRCATHIHRIRLRIGPLSGVEPEALSLAFTALSPGTMAEGADLETIPVPVRCRCQQCGLQFFPEGMVFLCSECGWVMQEAEQGQEFELTSLEVS